MSVSNKNLLGQVRIFIYIYIFFYPFSSDLCKVNQVCGLGRRLEEVNRGGESNALRSF